MQAFYEVYGEDRVSKVLTYSTEGTRSAILTVARGLGIDNDIASYIASLVLADRGITRSLHAMYYGDEDNPPVREFVNLMKQYPELWDGAQKIEGLCNGVGSHSGGVIFVDEPFTETCSLMRTNSGDKVTCFDLHDAEACSLIKIDLLSTEAESKIQVALELLLKDGMIKWQGSLRKTYEKYFGIKTFERDDIEMWKLLWDHKVLSMFQFEKDSGIQAISLFKPKSVDELATLNSVIRLMAQEKGGEIPLHKFARFKQDVNAWYKEMTDAGLTQDEQDMLKEVLSLSYGICAAQELMMILVMKPEIGGFPLSWADRLRKAVAKKQPKDFLALEKEYFENAKEKGLSKNLVKYVWYDLISINKGYSFNYSHTLAYSLIGLQELNIVYKYGALYWNTANLIVDSGSLNEDGNTDYGKIATAIATMQSNNIKVELPLVNTAEKNFVPDSEHNRIMYSLKAINGVGDNDIAAIIANRPFKDLNDFCMRMIETKIVKNSTMVSMIKAGCFDEIDGEDRKRTMNRYLKRYVFTQRDSLTMSNIPAMQSLGIIPERFKEIVRYTGFKNYILSEDFLVENVIIPNKKVPKCGYHDRLFKLDDISMPYFKEHFSEDSIERVEGDKYVISEKKIVKEIEIIFDPVREWLKSSEAVDLFNDATYKEIWDKHAKGTLSRWDMQALSYYYHKHELADLDLREYGVVDYYKLPRTPKVYDSYVRYVNNERIVIPKYEIVRIAGTVLNADNPHYTVTLATTTGVVKVKFNKGQYAYYNRQISAYLNGENKKTVLDKPWFRRGTLLLVCGYRQDDNFRAYRYKETIYLHTVSIIDEINEDGTLKLRSERNNPNGTED